MTVSSFFLYHLAGSNHFFSPQLPPQVCNIIHTHIYIYIYIPWSHHEIPWNHHFLSIFHPIVPGQCLQDGREFPRAERVEEAALRGATHPFRGGGWSARPGADAWTWWHFLMTEAWPKSQTGYITIYDILIYIYNYIYIRIRNMIYSYYTYIHMVNCRCIGIRGHKDVHISECVCSVEHRHVIVILKMNVVQ